jgi:acyl-CoA dehydrogenase family protein 9
MADLPYERMLRDARLNTIFGATNEILRTFIALTAMLSPERGAEAVAVEFDPSLLVPGEGRGLVGVVRRPLRGFGRLGELALRRARSALTRQRLSRHHPVLAPQAEVFDRYVERLTQSVETVMRKHGRNVVEMQYTQGRVADMAIDLYAIATCLARTTRAIARRGEEGAQREIDFTRIFVGAASVRLARTASAMEENDDELRKAVATRTYVDGGYSFDVF